MASLGHDSHESLENEVVLRSQVYMFRGQPCTLTLQEDRIICVGEPGSLNKEPSNVFTVALEDVIGLQVNKLPVSSLLMACKGELVSYEKPSIAASLSHSLPRNKVGRKLVKREIYFNGCGDFGDNLKTAVEWRETVQMRRIQRSKHSFVSTPEQIARSAEPLRLLVFINPFSGKKKSEKLYRTVVLPILEVAGVIIIEEVITESIGFAQKFIQTFDISKITGIMMVSGDGILYEVINGLMARPDWQNAIQIPLGILPTGSGNAMVTSQLHETNERGSDPLLSAVFQIVNGGIQLHDIASVVTESSHMYMGVCINWGLTGTIDIESEKFRFLGGDVRYLLGGLMCVAIKKSYYGRLDYLPIEDEEQKETSKRGSSDAEIENERFIGLVEDFEREQVGTIPTEGTAVLSEYHQRVESREENESQMTKQEFSGKPNIRDIASSSTTTDNSRPTTSISVTEQIPSQWKTIEGKFIVFIALMCSHITDVTPGHLSMKTGSGNLMLVYTTDSVTRRQLLSATTEPNDGDPNRVNFHTIITKAFRLTPLTPSILSVDGERMEYGPIQVQIHPGIMRLFSRKRK